MEEQELILRLSEGNETAYRQLFDLYGTQVFNTCLHFLRDVGEAEDMTQEVFLEVFRSVSGFRGDSKLSTWMYRIATTKCMEYQRYKKRKRRQAFFRSLLGMDEAREFMEQKVVEYRHPGLQLEQKETGAAIFRAIDALPGIQKAAFTLHHIEGLSYKEVADVLEKSLSSVESLIFRAKRQLRQDLEKVYRNES